MVWTGRKQIPVWLMGTEWYGGLTPKAGNGGAWSLDAVWLLRLPACLL